MPNETTQDEAPQGQDLDLDALFDQAMDEAPEAPPTEPADDEAAHPKTETSDQPRDQKGRFTSRTQDEEAPAAPEDEASPPEPAEAAESEDGPPESPAAHEDEPTEDAPVPDAFPAFTYRSDGQDYKIEGSAVGPDGVFIPKSQVPRITSELSAGRHHLSTFRQQLAAKDDEVQRARDLADAEATRSSTVLDFFNNLVENGQIHEWLRNVEVNWPVLQAQAEAAKKDKELAQLRERTQRVDQEQEDARLAPVMGQQLAMAIKHFGDQTNLPNEVRQRLFDRLSAREWRDQLFPRAEQDDPQLNVRRGQRRPLRADVVGREVQAIVSILGPQLQQQATPPPAAKPAPKAKASPPPTVSAKRGKAPSTKPQGKKPPQFKTSAEVDKWLDDEGYMDYTD